MCLKSRGRVGTFLESKKKDSLDYSQILIGNSENELKMIKVRPIFSDKRINNYSNYLQFLYP